MGIRQVPVKGGFWYLLEYEVCTMHGSSTPCFRYLIDYQVIILKRPNAMPFILPLSRSPCFTYTHECQQFNANPPCAIPASRPEQLGMAVGDEPESTPAAAEQGKVMAIPGKSLHFPGGERGGCGQEGLWSGCMVLMVEEVPEFCGKMVHFGKTGRHREEGGEVVQGGRGWRVWGGERGQRRRDIWCRTERERSSIREPVWYSSQRSMTSMSSLRAVPVIGSAMASSKEER